MLDNSKEGLIFNHKNTSLSSSFAPISEKQEELSVSSIQGNNEKKNSNKNIKENITKHILGDVDVIKHCETQKNKKIWIMNNQNNNFLFPIKEDNNKDEEQNKHSLNKNNTIKQNKKKILKRNSVQERGKHLLSVPTSEKKEKLIKKGSIGKQGVHFLNNNLNFGHTPDNSKNYSGAKSLGNDTFEIKYINQLNNKKTVLHKGKLDFNDKTEIKIFDQIKNSPLFEKSDNLIFKLKISYVILGIFSLTCIILNYSDAIIYNNKSLEYIYKENNNTFPFNNDIEFYYHINNRKISSRENNIRIFSGIFSLLCDFILIIIFQFKRGNNDNRGKNTKKEKFRRMLNAYYSKQKKKNIEKNKSNQLKQEEERTKNEKIKVIDLNPDSKDFKRNASTIEDRNKTIRMCIFNIIFYPPFINKSFVGKYHNIIFVYSLNSIFLLLSLYKINNIYKAIFYLSSINNSFNKAICSSHLVDLDTKFMLKYSIKRHPIIFLIFHLILALISVGIVLSTIEFFTLDKSGIYLEQNLQDKEDYFFKVLTTYFFFIIRNIYEEHCIKSILGKLILFFGGAMGMVISSYFIYYFNVLIEFSPEEQTAYSKLSKLLNPVNKEHKASNLIKSLLLLTKICKDNLNTEKDYRLKLEDLNRPSYVQRRPIFPNQNIFQFTINSNGTNQNLLNANDINDYEEKKKFIKYIIKVFLFKIKYIVESKDFNDNLKIARDSSLTFNDVLKKIGNKMDTNISQLNNKIESLIQNDQKYLNFIKFTKKNINNIKKIRNYHNFLLQYLTEVHNEYLKQIMEFKKETEKASSILRMSSNAFPKRIKSNIFGKIQNKKPNQSKFFYADSNKKKKKLKKDLYDFNNNNFKYSIKKQKSSIVLFSVNSERNILEEKIKQNKEKLKNKSSNKRLKHKTGRGRTKSMEDWRFHKPKSKDQGRKSRKSVIQVMDSNISRFNSEKNNKILP